MPSLTNQSGSSRTALLLPSDAEEDGAVTVRDRDTMEQERIKIEDLDAYFEKKFTW